MKIEYKFLTGETVAIEVSDTFSEISIEIDRTIYNSDHRETRRHNSIDNLAENGLQLPDKRNNLEESVLRSEEHKILHQAISMLLPQQQKLVKQVFFEERSMADIAREEGVTGKAIQERVNKIKIRLKKIIEENLY